MRAKMLERDGYRCKQCGKAGRLEIHHIEWLKNGGSETDPTNLETLCVGCHKAIHKRPQLAGQAALDLMVQELSK